ncbi:hypothetical protein GCM10027610_118750 [Dactylosporangium cerinum]
MVLALGGAAAATWALRGGGDGGETDLASSTWVDMRAEVGVKAIEELLARHTQAVKKKDLNAWMADVDQSDAAFAKRQKQLFDNLVKMPFSDISFDRTKLPARQLARFLPTQLFDRYHAAVHVEAVTIRHRIEGVDSKTVAIPWMPVVALVKGKWRIVGDAVGKDLPLGANGQPWDSTGPVAVLRNDRVIAVVSVDDAERGAACCSWPRPASSRSRRSARPAGTARCCSPPCRTSGSSTRTLPSRRSGSRRWRRSRCRTTTRSVTGRRHRRTARRGWCSIRRS